MDQINNLDRFLPVILTVILLLVIIIIAILIAKFTIGTIFKTSSAFLVISILNTTILDKFDFKESGLLYISLNYIANKFMTFAIIGFVVFYIANLVKYIVQKRLLATISWILLGLIIIATLVIIF